MSKPHRTLKEIINNVEVLTSGCHKWLGYINTKGYGIVYFKGLQIPAHKFFYTLRHGKVTKDKILCHICDNRYCVNVEHLFLGTYKDNTLDMIRKGRHPQYYMSVNGVRSRHKDIFVHPRKSLTKSK